MSSHFLLMSVLCMLLLMALNKAESFTAVWSSNGSYDWLLQDSLFTSLQNEVHSDADIIICYSCYCEFSQLHSVRPCKGMYIQIFVKGAVETSWLKCNIFYLCFGGGQFKHQMKHQLHWQNLRCFPQSLQNNAGLLLSNMSQVLPDTAFPVHYSLASIYSGLYILSYWWWH